ncbi:aromatic amino acid transaminase [Sagittula sp. S175]|uniref:aromatic amino acid transaminase n=1 Tax=Sagittula sp. S175 TaxID=3415129 RepID=UPI003C7B8C0E
MFEAVEDYPVDPIMIGMDLFAQDPRKDKLNLTVGIYEDAEGRTPVLNAVKQAERLLVERQETKAYTALTGDAAYCDTLGDALFGSLHDGVVTAQTAGGAVALRVAADLLAQMPSRPTVWVQTPTYGNYIPILNAAGTPWQAVPYYDQARAQVTFDAMLDGLKAARPGDLFLVQGVCHNPTGADMTPEQFDALLDLLEARGIVPWIDLAYLGFADSFDADCQMARKVLARFDESIVCITLSKSFGIYRDRAGALFLKTRPAQRARVKRAITAIIRSNTSHAPDHGASVVRTILGDSALKALWLGELDAMRTRVAGVRQDIVREARARHNRDDLDFLAGQRGMFSLLPVTTAEEEALTRDHGIHVVKGGRVNVARLRGGDVATLVDAVFVVKAL